MEKHIKPSPESVLIKRFSTAQSHFWRETRCCRQRYHTTVRWPRPHVQLHTELRLQLRSVTNRAMSQLPHLDIPLLQGGLELSVRPSACQCTCECQQTRMRSGVHPTPQVSVLGALSATMIVQRRFGLHVAVCWGSTHDSGTQRPSTVLGWNWWYSSP